MMLLQNLPGKRIITGSRGVGSASRFLITTLLGTCEMTYRRMRPPSEKVYKFFGPKFRCAYCGESADTIDHTTPRWFVSANIQLIQRFNMIKVASCRQCNSLAGKVIDETWKARKTRIAKMLATRAKRLLMTADWPQDELEELGYSLRACIEQAQHDATIVRRRLIMLRDASWPYDVPQELQIPADPEDFEYDELPSVAA